MALAYSVSRPTIREAIIALELERPCRSAGRFGGLRPGWQRERIESGRSVKMDIGAFELTEARLLIEGEVSALAATQITDEEVAELESLLEEMSKANSKSAGAGELVDRKFHELIANITRNSAMVASVEQLWTIRNRSPQCVRTFEKTRKKGYVPVVDEHAAIVEALKSRDPNSARAAMRGHLSRVLDYLLDATEVEAIEEAKAKMAAQRSRFNRKSQL